jgi:uncharacterized protein (TIGR03083 family)
MTATLTHLDVLRDALDHLERFEERVRQAEELSRPSTLPGWTVEDLVRHVVAAAWQQAEALHRTRVNAKEQPAYVTVGVEPRDLKRAVGAAREYLANAASGLDRTTDPLVALPFATLPASIAAYVLLIEYGVHLYDLDRALGDTHDLSASVADAVIDLMGGMLPMLAGAHPDGPVTYAIDIDDGRSVRVSWTGETWDSAGAGEPDCTISGSASSVALFSLGRIAADDPSLRVGGDLALAQSFKTYFPGP